MTRHARCALLLAVVAPLLAVELNAAEPTLIAHWPLAGDAQDRSAAGLHGTIRGVRFEAADEFGPDAQCAVFDGRDDVIEVPDDDALDLATAPFSIVVWVKTEPLLDDMIGNLLGKFDPQRRRGWNFCIRTDTGTTFQPNHRQVFFGIDDGKTAPSWSDHGRPGQSLFVFALCVHDGSLYAATFEHNAPGRVYRYESPDTWVDCGSPHNSNAVTSLAVFEGQLYAGVGDYRARGSALEESTLREPGGRVYRYQGGTTWTDCGKIGDAATVGSLIEYRGHLYSSALYTPVLSRYDGEQRWISCGDPGRRVGSLTRYNGSIFASTYDGSLDLPGGHVNRYDGQSWTSCGLLPNVHQTYAFAVYEGQLHVSTWPEGRIFRFDGGERWTDCGRLGEEKEVMSMLVYNGKLYGGTLPSADVYRYEGQQRWTNVGRTDTTPVVRYRRSWSLAVYDGKLFCGTLPSGHVFSLEAGKSVLSGRPLEPGWRHLVAVRGANRLKLYVDGKLAATSGPFAPEEFDISNDQPLSIGYGQQDYFHGRMRELRLYRGALSAEAIERMYQAKQ